MPKSREKFLLWETEASSGWADRKILGQGQGRSPHPLGDPS